MSVLWGIFAVVLILAWIITARDIVRRHLGTKRTSAWLLVVVLLPFVGVLMYWALRERHPVAPSA